MLISLAGRDDADDLFAIFRLPVNMHDNQEKPASDHSQGVPSLFPLFVDPVLDQHYVRVFEHAGGRPETEPMLPLVGPIFCRVPFEPLHVRYTYRITLCQTGARSGAICVGF
jgi:hypothetical protein